MRYTIAILAGILAILTSPLVAQEQPALAGETSVLAWDAVTENVDGTPADDIAGYDVVLVPEGQAINDLTWVAKAWVTETQKPVQMFFEQAVQPGTYVFAVRAVDQAGNRSEWSTLRTVFDRGKPSRPAGMRVITITLNLSIE